MNWNYARYGLENVKQFGEYDFFLFEVQNARTGLTNVQIQRQSNALARGLLELGLGPGQVVAVILPNGPAVPVTYTGLFKVGAVFLPVVFALTAPEIRYILEDSGAAAFITDEELYPKVEEAARGLAGITHHIVISDSKPPESAISFASLLDRPSGDLEIAPLKADDLAVLMYTSGTTGSPKGVMLTHRNLGSNLESGLRFWPTTPDDTILIPLPLNHIFGLLMLNECNLSGAKMILHKWFDPELVLDSITRHQVTQFCGVPTMYIKMLELYHPGLHDTSSVRRWICAAAPLSLETLAAVEEKLGARVFQGYGLTEAAPTLTRQSDDHPVKPGSVGRVIDGVEVRIMDESDKPLPTGQVGEICAKGQNVMKGYLNKENQTQEALKGGWLHTGDMGYLDEDGDLFITDRKKDLIIRGGENISPAEVEEVLYKHPGILEAAVVGLPDALYGEEVAAFVVLKAGYTVSEQELIDHCLKFIHRYKAPKSVVQLNELPKNAVGKILKRSLRNR